VNFFEEDDSRLPPPPPPRRKRNKKLLRVQRLAILLVALFVVAFLLALWVRSCQHNRKVGGYREYFAAVQTAVNDSNVVGTDLARIIGDPSRFTRAELSAKLDDMVKKQDEVASRVKLNEPPSRLSSENNVFVLGMAVRAQGMRLMRDAIVAKLGGKGTTVTPARLAALSGYFTGPDAYYMQLLYTQAQKAMAQDGVSSVTVPKSQYYLTSGMFDRASLKAMLSRISKSANLHGVHGVGLVSAVAQPGDKRLVAGKQNQVTADAKLAFVVAVQNQGTVTETNVPVVLTFDPPGDAQTQKLTQTIATIKPNQTATVQFTGLTIDTVAIGRVSKITVKAGPVPQEQVLSNNTRAFSIILKL